MKFKNLKLYFKKIKGIYTLKISVELQNRVVEPSIKIEIQKQIYFRLNFMKTNFSVIKIRHEINILSKMIKNRNSKI